MNTDRLKGPVHKVRARRDLTDRRLHDLEAGLTPVADPVTPLSMLYRQGDRVHDNDLVTLADFCRLAGLHPGRLTKLEGDQRRGVADYGIPPPKVVGRSVRLWSARELAYWWNRR